MDCLSDILERMTTNYAEPLNNKYLFYFVLFIYLMLAYLLIIEINYRN